MKQTWTVAPEQARMRLDVFLTEQMPDATRSSLAKRIKAGEVTVNAKPATVHKFLNPGDVIAIREYEKPVLSPQSLVLSRTKTANRDLGLRTKDLGPALKKLILEETPDWIVLDKPAGVLVHPTHEEETDTLADMLAAYDPAIAKVGEDPSRPGIMHRLDREASGLMVVAKTQDAFDSLKRQFAEHTTDKTYLAIAYGHPAKDEGDIKFKIGRSSTHARMAARPESAEDGKAAWTHFRVRERLKNASLLELNIFSGRTHQIRAHLHALGIPIIGDPLYKPKSIKTVPADRLYLQAVRLTFTDPTSGERRTFDIPMEPAFKDKINSLKPKIAKG